MSEVKVTRAHRELAVAAQGATFGALDESAERWLETGKPAGVAAPARFFYAAKVARGYAEAEQRGYAKCQADVVAVVKARMAEARERGFMRAETGSDAGVLVARTKLDELDQLLALLELNEHIGASDSVPSGRGKGE
jgi:hypothetical protein